MTDRQLFVFLGHTIGTRISRNINKKQFILNCSFDINCRNMFFVTTRVAIKVHGRFDYKYSVN